MPPGAVARMITADAIAAHRTFSVEVRHPVEVDAGQEAHLVQWLSKRLGRSLVVPDLAAAGFQLMAGGCCRPRMGRLLSSCTRTAMENA